MMRHFSIVIFYALVSIFIKSECRIRNNIDDWDEDAIYLKCGNTTDEEVIVLTNPNYPNGYPNGTVCNYYIRRFDHKVTQLRLEFIQTHLAPPTGDGLCTRDYISVESDTLNVPRLCGDLSGQHVYVHLPKHKKFWTRRKFRKILGLNIKIAASSSFFFIRRWKIRVIQIRHHKKRFFRGLRHKENTIYRAPTNCLQYFTNPSGTISSFNYYSGESSSFNSLGVIGSRQIANLVYTVCIRQEHFNCAIIYERPTTDSFAFTLTGDVLSVDRALLGTSVLQETACTTDYIQIPTPFQMTAGVWTVLATDRFCGLGFKPTLSQVRAPFMFNVVTDANETPDIANRGFYLKYRQQVTCT